MDDAVAVRVGEGGRDRSDRGDHLAGTEPPAAGEQRGEAAALEQLEDERDPGLAAAAGLVDDLDQADQVRVVEFAEQRGLPGLPCGIARRPAP